MVNIGTSPSGQPIYRHGERQTPFQLALGNEETIKAVGEHVEQYIGRIAGVYHEMISDLVHLDLFLVAPTPERNFYTLVTCGMSDLPMTVPPGAETYRYAELMLALPPTWRFSQEDFKDESCYWPIRLLKTMARLPHEYNTWLHLGHTVPNGDPAEPYAAGTKLNGVMLTIPASLDNVPGFFKLKLSETKTVHFFGLVPLYEEEMAFKLKHGADKLFEKLDRAGISELLDPQRKCVLRKRFWFW
ncbi:suppressor of fused domain protein [Paenibacillus chartarius]|uniref:Suppressor of fused domain protein n=1 Tax=Paenibacillus chartarius TaxID=747481 RepID=A0ABV6DM42_9BACL